MFISFDSSVSQTEENFSNMAHPRRQGPWRGSLKSSLGVFVHCTATDSWVACCGSQLSEHFRKEKEWKVKTLYFSGLWVAIVGSSWLLLKPRLARRLLNLAPPTPLLGCQKKQKLRYSIGRIHSRFRTQH